MSREKTLIKGKVIKPNIELWDKTYPAEPKNYHNSMGVVDFVVTPNVLSWVNQGLVELYKGGAKDAAPAKVVSDEPTKEDSENTSSEDDDQEAKSKKKKKSSKKKG